MQRHLTLIAVTLSLTLLACVRKGTLLLAAAREGRKDGMERLLAEGAKVNARDYNGATPLHLAIGEGSKDVAELLLARGPVINAKDNEGTAPLHWAAWWGRKEAAELLLDKGAQVDIRASG